MTAEMLINYCLQKEQAYLDFPFGDIPICVKVCDKIFAEIYPRKDNYKITLKCDPVLARIYRTQYPESVVPGYHVPNRQKPYKNTVYIDRDVPDIELFKMIDHSYSEVVKKLPGFNKC